MAFNTQISQDKWKDFLVSFSNGNRGRMLSLEVLGSDSSDTGQMKQGKLMAVDYDPVGKGNDIVVTTGDDEIDYSHTIEAAVEIWKVQQDSGEVAALEIIDQNNVKTILRLS